MRYIGNVEKDAQVRAVASGVLSNGDTVIVNSDGTVSAVSGASAATGTEVVYQSGQAEYSVSAYDASNDKVVVFYRIFSGGATYGAVGTISGTSISFGSGVSTGLSGEPLACVYDSTNNKVVIFAVTGGGAGSSVVATVSGTSMSFGSVANFTSSSVNPTYYNPVFDTNTGKVVLFYADSSNSYYGNAVVGTVSGTSISFGTPVVFNSASTFSVHGPDAATFDSSNNKVVITYRDAGYANSKVGTVSGTSISFGSAAAWTSNVIAEPVSSYDADQGKVFVFYRDQTDSNINKGVLGTVSGTSISYGTPATVYDSASSYGRDNRISYNAAAKTHLISFKDDTTENLYFVEVVVSGSSFTASSDSVYATTSSAAGTIAYDSGSEANVIFFQDGDNSLYGTAFVKVIGSTNLTSDNFIGFADSGYADTQSAAINTTCSVDRNQTGLTAGQKYYVQTDGSLGLSADTPSVEAGTAISSTEILVKG